MNQTGKLRSYKVMLCPLEIRIRVERRSTNLKTIGTLLVRSLELVITRVKIHILGKIERRIGIMQSVDSFSPPIRSKRLVTGSSSSLNYFPAQEKVEETIHHSKSHLDPDKESQSFQNL